MITDVRIDGGPTSCDRTQMRASSGRLLSMLWGAAVLGACWVTGCAGAARKEPTSRPPSPMTPTVAVPMATTEPSPAVEPSPVAPEPEPEPGADHRSVARCDSDADCGWNDPCVPTRCMAAVSSDLKCSETRPAPGACLCWSGRCTLKPKRPPKAQGPCEVRGCVVDRAGGTCVADTRGVKENFRHNSGAEAGPSCDCLKPAAGCAFTWYEPVACTTVRDCWVDSEPRPHPVRRPAHRRGGEFKPCHDGEISPQCGPAGHCVLGGFWDC
jgi:hypothetical protein